MIRIKPTRTEKGMLVLAALEAVAGLVTAHYAFAAGVGVALPVSLGLFRWQLGAVTGLDNLPPKAVNRFLGRSLIRSSVALALLVLALAGGIEFLFGVLAGLLLQVMVYMGEAILIMLRKEGWD
ncbi:hypothetical protein [Moorella sulfitireducens (nom. illeg.)]|uniref:hypothetical protein n=1 Tax=Neomoorella sulfitireducens TaxID=2972948 RepID=UPI0021AD3D06|nr:hypothetical protein [Moorella sulfitireducens]